MRVGMFLSGLVFVVAVAILAAVFLQHSGSRGFGEVFVVYTAGPIAIVSGLVTLLLAAGSSARSPDEPPPGDATPRRRRKL